MIEILYSISALGFALLVPGYFVGLGFFPKKGELSGMERFTLSFVLSIALVPLGLALENILLQIPINYFSVAGTMLAFIVIGFAVWKFRGKKSGDAVPLLPESISKLLGK